MSDTPYRCPTCGSNDPAVRDYTDCATDPGPAHYLPCPDPFHDTAQHGTAQCEVSDCNLIDSGLIVPADEVEAALMKSLPDAEAALRELSIHRGAGDKQMLADERLRTFIRSQAARIAELEAEVRDLKLTEGYTSGRMDGWNAAVSTFDVDEEIADALEAERTAREKAERERDKACHILAASALRPGGRGKYAFKPTHGIGSFGYQAWRDFLAQAEGSGE